MLGRTHRRVVAGTLAAATMLIPASPALAHYCYKNFKSEPAAAKAAKSTAWSSKADMVAFVESGALPECMTPDALAWLETQPNTILFMGPGLLAGGTEGTDRTPANNISYIPIGDFIEDCSPEELEGF